MAYISVIGPEEAEGALKRIYDSSIERAGKVYGIVSIQSLNPEALRAGLKLYKVLMFGESPLSRAEREMIAVATSAANKCHY